MKFKIYRGLVAVINLSLIFFLFYRVVFVPVIDLPTDIKTFFVTGFVLATIMQPLESVREIINLFAFSSWIKTIIRGVLSHV